MSGRARSPGRSSIPGGRRARTSPDRRCAIRPAGKRARAVLRAPARNREGPRRRSPIPPPPGANLPPESRPLVVFRPAARRHRRAARPRRATRPRRIQSPALRGERGQGPRRPPRLALANGRPRPPRGRRTLPPTRPARQTSKGREMILRSARPSRARRPKRTPRSPRAVSRRATTDEPGTQRGSPRPRVPRIRGRPNAARMRRWRPR
jgi:hypothetical protein